MPRFNRELSGVFGKINRRYSSPLFHRIHRLVRQTNY